MPYMVTICCKDWLLYMSVASFLTLLVGCSTIGADRLRAGRSEYNTAIKDTDVNQLLLNIVRLRYSDKPYFLDIASVSATSEVGGTLGIKDDKSIAQISMFERPNIVYVPVDGERFVQQLLEPLDLDTLRLLRGAGWEIDDIFRVFTNRINDVPNAPTGAGSTPEGRPEFHDFLLVTETLDELEDSGALIIAGNSERPGELVLSITAEGRSSTHFAELVRLLDLDETSKRYRVLLGLQRSGRNDIAIETRPILSAMFYLGQGIELPQSVRDEKIVHSGLADDEVEGEQFDWQEVLNGLIKIRSSSTEPVNAYAAIRYEDYWFYIANNDVDSKETLTMLSVVLSLKAGGANDRGPILTLPVGGGN